MAQLQTSTFAADALLERIRRAFVAQPALRLTLPQASRLFALDPSTCYALLNQLVDRRELILAPDGEYQRFDVLPPSHAAGADLSAAFWRR